jgi:hypothetical protein
MTDYAYSQTVSPVYLRQLLATALQGALDAVSAFPLPVPVGTEPLPLSGDASTGMPSDSYPLTEGLPPSLDALSTETVYYTDGSSATGTAPLPDHSPDGAPAVVNPEALPPSDIEVLVDAAPSAASTPEAMQSELPPPTDIDALLSEPQPVEENVGPQ